MPHVLINVFSQLATGGNQYVSYVSKIIIIVMAVVISSGGQNKKGIDVQFMKKHKMVLCQDLVQVKMRNFSHFNPPEAQPQCVFFHTIVRIHLVTYSCNGYEFVSYCKKLPDIQKSTGMPAYNREF